MDYSYVAGKAASRKAENIMMPLLDTIVDDESNDESEPTVRSFKSVTMESVKLTPMQKLKIFAVYVLATGGIAVSVAAMIMAPVIVVFVMGGVYIANAPYTAVKEKKIAKLPTLRAMNNRLREDAGRLEEEMDALNEEINLLIPQAERTAEIEGEIRLITKKQDININKLVELVKENDSILVKMRDNLQQRIAQDIITIIIKSDINNDSTIDKFETKMLALRIRLQLQEYGVDFDAAKFMIAIQKDPSMTGAMNIAMKLFEKSSGDSSEELEPSKDDNAVFDMFYLASEDAEKTSLFSSESQPSTSSVGSSMRMSRRFSISAKDMNVIQQSAEISLTKRDSFAKSETLRLLEEGRPESSRRLLDR